MHLFRLVQERLARESVRLGRVEPEGGAFSTAWVQKDGSAMLMLHERERSIETKRLALEEAKKQLRKRRGSGKAAGTGGEEVLDPRDTLDSEEGLKLRAALLTKEAAELAVEKKNLEREAQVWSSARARYAFTVWSHCHFPLAPVSTAKPIPSLQYPLFSTLSSPRLAGPLPRAQVDAGALSAATRAA